MIRTKREAGSGNLVEAVCPIRAVVSAIRRVTTLGDEELMTEAKNRGGPYELERWVGKSGHLPAAGPVSLGFGILKSSDPAPGPAPSSRPPRAARIPISSRARPRASKELGEATPGGHHVP